MPLFTTSTYTPVVTTCSSTFSPAFCSTSPIAPSLSTVYVRRPHTTLNPRPVLTITPSIATTIVPRPTVGFYYDSGIGSNPLAIEQTLNDLRYKFLDKWLYTDFDNLLKYLKVADGRVSVIKSQNKIKSNDVSQDSEKDLIKKSDYIAHNILTRKKTRKILEFLIRKNQLKWYDLPHNEHIVKKEFAKYIKKKLKNESDDD